jgi:PhnB protein
MVIQPYLNFEGRCEEAVEFYKRKLGAEVSMLMHNSDAPGDAHGGCPTPPPADKVMHAALQIGGSVLMATDGMCQGTPNFQGFSLSLTAANDAEATRLFEALASEGGNVTMPIAPTFFASRFGMVTDRFGVGWMVLSMPAGK